jgi:fused signal recognition particle receptor
MFGFKDKPPEPATPPRRGLFARLRERLGKTRDGLTGGLATLFRGRRIDDELLEELETRLLLADVGIDATRQIVGDLTERLKHHQLADGEALFAALREEMETILAPCTRPLEVAAPGGGTFVVLMVGVNGAGKTTTIGKLAGRLQAEGRSVMLAAGDTFRAAAVEQLQEWGRRHDVPVVAQQTGADSASVIFDALQAARARGVDVLIADTAGRLHTKSNLMEELKKIVRVLRKLDPEAPHEVMLVVDAGTGQNALVQAQQFHAATDLTGITLTKLDGTAKGGIVLAIARQLGVPIRFIGIGEQADDLRPFDGGEFVAALLDLDAG